jgi:hypothetical protein
MKSCTKCKQERDLGFFRTKTNGKLDSWCRECYKKNSRNYEQKNKEKIAEYKKTDAYKALKAKWNLDYTNRNKESLLAKKREGYSRIRDSHLKKMKEHYQKNSDAYKQRAKKWKQDNRALHNARCMDRYTSKIKRCPAWAKEITDLVCKEAYDKAVRLFKLTGVSYDVDHIVPLLGKTVSGLHVYNNLQVIPASVNRSKKNLYWPDQWQSN